MSRPGLVRAREENWRSDRLAGILPGNPDLVKTESWPLDFERRSETEKAGQTWVVARPDADFQTAALSRLARAVRPEKHPEFDLISNRSGKGSQGIEVKGRTGIRYVELTENEWPKAFHQRGRYRLFVVYDCGTQNPRSLGRAQDASGKMVTQARAASGSTKRPFSTRPGGFDSWVSRSQNP